MSFGLLGIQNQMEGQAIQGLQQSAQIQQQNEIANKQLKAAEKQQTTSNVATGAGIGLMAGAQIGAIGGPMGMAIGAGVGFLASKLF